MQWEYKTTGSMISDSEMNQLGTDGWELLSVLKNEGYPGGTNITLYFKRPVPSVNPPLSPKPKQIQFREIYYPSNYKMQWWRNDLGKTVFQLTEE